jgi:hypothetical protein
LLLGRLSTRGGCARNVERLHRTALDEKLARVWHDRVAILGCAALFSISNIGFEHVRERVEVVMVVRATNNFDGSAVHVPVNSSQQDGLKRGRES